MTNPTRPDRLTRAVRALLTRDPASVRVTPSADDTSARLDALEREVQEMRTRVNALFFAVITAGVADLVVGMVRR